MHCVDCRKSFHSWLAQIADMLQHTHTKTNNPFQTHFIVTVELPGNYDSPQSDQWIKADGHPINVVLPTVKMLMKCPWPKTVERLIALARKSSNFKTKNLGCLQISAWQIVFFYSRDQYCQTFGTYLHTNSQSNFINVLWGFLPVAKFAPIKTK